MADLRLIGLTKHYGPTLAVDHLDLAVTDREFMTLLGPSGSGKTTVLRMVAGHVPPSAGTIVVGARQVQDLPPEQRDIGMVFQSYALFPHLTVFGNVAFGLERRHVPRREVARRVAEALTLVQLDRLAARRPRELSGGQQQRVALARALVIRPPVLLLDEPLSNLDANLRGEVRLEIRRLQRELGITTLLVTHDQEEALTVSDRVAVLRDGRLQQVASPVELYRRPANRFVAEFVGKMNWLPLARIETRGSRAVYRLPDGEPVTGPAGAEQRWLAIRPEEIRLGAPSASIEATRGRGCLGPSVFLGELVETSVTLQDGTILTVRGSARDATPGEVGEIVQFWWPTARASILDEE